jgi:uncharacterized membrane protein YiaA
MSANQVTTYLKYAHLQKSVRDSLDGVAVTSLYCGLCLLLLVVGLWNAELATSEKGFYAMSFVLSLFAAIAVQKNVRDVAGIGGGRPAPASAPRPERTE